MKLPKRNLTFVFLGVALLGVVFVTSLLPRTGRPAGYMRQTAGIAAWKTYRNSSLSFELKYPSDLEVLEGKAFTYNRQTLSAVFNLCLAPIHRKELSCEVELYVSDEPHGFETASAGPFLGLPRAAEEESLLKPLMIDGVESKYVSASLDGEIISNIFFIRRGKVYLFVRHKLGAADGMNRFRMIMTSFKRL